MKNSIILQLCICACFYGFSQKPKYELIQDDDAIWVEKFDSTIVDENRYNWNNTIFKVGSSFLYKFVHLTKTGDSLFFKLNKTGNWDFVTKTDVDNTTISTVLIHVDNGLSNFANFPDYNQTVISYVYGKETPFSASGVIENERNVWMHPPRDKYFQILELNPFPYIQAPFSIGKEWTWKLAIGDFWSDYRWRSWNGKITSTYTYKITAFQKISTALGTIPCYRIESYAKSRLGKTTLVAHFNKKHGFVKLDYTNIDGSRTILDLIQHTVP